MPLRTFLADRLVRALAAGAVLAAAGCAHAPATQPSARQERQDRVLVTGSRIPRPVGRDGLPITDSPVRIYTLDQLGRAGYGDLGRMLRTTDVNVQ
ncbi:MAG TPA: hypothetical protein VIV57_26300 [Anaeromyxobacter sp.]